MARTAEIINARTGLTLSQASIHGFVSKAAVELKPMIAKIANLCRQDQVLHLDETGMTVNGKTLGKMGNVGAVVERSLTLAEK